MSTLIIYIKCVLRVSVKKCKEVSSEDQHHSQPSTPQPSTSHIKYIQISNKYSNRISNNIFLIKHLQFLNTKSPFPQQETPKNSTALMSSSS